jgi:hypothetical protein
MPYLKILIMLVVVGASYVVGNVISDRVLKAIGSR